MPYTDHISLAISEQDPDLIGFDQVPEAMGFRTHIAWHILAARGLIGRPTHRDSGIRHVRINGRLMVSHQDCAAIGDAARADVEAGQ